MGVLLKLDRRNLSMRLIEKANFINNYYVPSMAEALATKDDVRLWQYIGRLEEDREITSVVVLGDKGEVRYHRETDKIGTPWEEDNTLKVLKSGEALLTSFKNAGGQALLLVSPLKIQGVSEPIGALRLELTYNHVEEIIRTALGQFLPVALVLILVGGAVMFALSSWSLSAPLKNLQENIASINPASPEATLPESRDEWGRIYQALNDFILRLKSERQSFEGQEVRLAEQEKRLIDQWLRPLLPDRMILAADKDNRLIPGSQHLMDLIADGNFATLVTTAFQKEGEMVQGDVAYEGKPYRAAVVSIPGEQSLAVKTLIVLSAK